MRPLLLSTTFWLLLALTLYAIAVAFRRGALPLGAALRVVERRAVVAFLLLGGVVNLVLRLVAGYINPRDFVQDYVAATEFMAGRSMYPQDFAAIGASVVAEEPFPGRAWLESVPIFRGEFARLTETAPGNAHPPLMGVALGLPAELLGLRGSFLLMAVGLLAVVVWSLRTILREYGLHASRWQWLAMLGLLAGWHPLNAAIRSAQPGILLLGLVVGGWAALRRNRPAVAGILIGLAACIQAFPLLLVGYLGVRRPLAFAASAATIALVTTGVALLAPVGASSEWSAAMAWIAPRFVGVTENISLVGLSIRSLRLLGQDGDFRIIAIAWMALTGVAGAVFLLPGRWIVKSTEELDTEFSLVVALMLLLSPLAWTRYLPLLLLPIITIMMRVWAHKLRQPSVLALLTGTVMLSLPDGAAVQFAEHLTEAAPAGLSLLPVGSITLSICLLCALLARDLRRHSSRTQPAGFPGPLSDE